VLGRLVALEERSVLSWPCPMQDDHPVTNVRLHAIDPTALTGDDIAALSELSAAVSDGGAVSFRLVPTLGVADYLRLTKPDSVGVLATEGGSGRPVGAAWLDFGVCTLGGRRTRYALLNGLQVHPGFRRRGIAAELTEWRLARAQQSAGRTAAQGAGSAATDRDLPVVPLATIQHGNVASLGNARRWATRISAPLTVTPVPMRREAPRNAHPWTIRPAGSDDLAVVAAGLAQSRSAFCIGPDLTPESLRHWLSRGLDGRPLNRYMVITGPDDRPLAGLGVHDQPRYSQMQVTGLNPALRWVARLAGVVPASGTMRNLQAVLPWCVPGAQPAGRVLWRELLYRERRRGTSIVTTIDARDPSRAMVRAARWLPTTSIVVASRPPEGMHYPDGPIELPV